MMHGDRPHRCHIIKSLQPQPKRLSTRVAVTFSAQKASQTGYHAHGLTERRRFRGRNRVFADISNQRLPFRLLEENRTRHIGSLSAKLKSNEKYARQPPCQWPSSSRSDLHDPIAVLQSYIRFSAYDDKFQFPSAPHTRPPSPRLAQRW